LLNKRIGDLFKVSQATAWNAVKEVSIVREMQDLRNELAQVKRELIESKQLQKKPLLEIVERVK